MNLNKLMDDVILKLQHKIKDIELKTGLNVVALEGGTKSFFLYALFSKTGIKIAHFSLFVDENTDVHIGGAGICSDFFKI